MIDVQTIPFPPRVNLALVAYSEEHDEWFGYLCDSTKHFHEQGKTGESLPKYKFFSLMHELASRNRVNLRIIHPDRTEEVLEPYAV